MDCNLCGEKMAVAWEKDNLRAYFCSGCNKTIYEEIKSKGEPIEKPKRDYAGGDKILWPDQ